MTAGVMSAGTGGTSATIGRYTSTCFSDDWLANEAIDIRPWQQRIEAFLDVGTGSLVDQVD